MAWASQLWKHYDPINGIIFPGASLKSTYDEKGKGLTRALPDLSTPSHCRPVAVFGNDAKMKRFFFFSFSFPFLFFCFLRMLRVKAKKKTFPSCPPTSPPPSLSHPRHHLRRGAATMRPPPSLSLPSNVGAVFFSSFAAHLTAQGNPSWARFKCAMWCIASPWFPCTCSSQEGCAHLQGDCSVLRLWCFAPTRASKTSAGRGGPSYTRTATRPTSGVRRRRLKPCRGSWSATS